MYVSSAAFESYLRVTGALLEQAGTDGSSETESSLRTARMLQRLYPNARQCGACGKGPVLHYNCSNLSTHHMQETNNGLVSNACRNCGWFAGKIQDWPLWNGLLDFPPDSRLRRPRRRCAKPSSVPVNDSESSGTSGSQSLAEDSCDEWLPSEESSDEEWFPGNRAGRRRGKKSSRTNKKSKRKRP